MVALHQTAKKARFVIYGIVIACLLGADAPRHTLIDRVKQHIRDDPNKMYIIPKSASGKRKKCLELIDQLEGNLKDLRHNIEQGGRRDAMQGALIASFAGHAVIWEAMHQ